MPFVPREGPDTGERPTALAVDSTLAGRTYQHVETFTDDDGAGRVQAWVPFGLGLDAFLAGEAAEDLAPEAHVGTEQLEPGDYLLLYTDGVVEARSPGGELFGVPRLTDLMIRNLAAGLPASETMRRAVFALLEHRPVTSSTTRR